MARPTVVNTATANSGSANSLTFSLPTLTEGNLMIVLVGQDGSDSVYTAPAGWVSQGHLAPPTIQCSAEVFTKTVGAGEPTNPQFTSDRTDAFAGGFVQYDNNAALDGAVQTASADTGAPNPPSITPTDGETLAVALLVLDRDAISSATMTNYTQNVQRGAGGSGDRVSVQMYSRALTGTSAEDPPAISLGDDNWTAMTLLLKDGSIGGATALPMAMNHYRRRR